LCYMYKRVDAFVTSISVNQSVNFKVAYTLQPLQISADRVGLVN